MTDQHGLLWRHFIIEVGFASERAWSITSRRLSCAGICSLAPLDNMASSVESRFLFSRITCCNIFRSSYVKLIAGIDSMHPWRPLDEQRLSKSAWPFPAKSLSKSAVQPFATPIAQSILASTWFPVVDVGCWHFTPGGVLQISLRHWAGRHLNRHIVIYDDLHRIQAFQIAKLTVFTAIIKM